MGVIALAFYVYVSDGRRRGVGGSVVVVIDRFLVLTMTCSQSRSEDRCTTTQRPPPRLELSPRRVPPSVGPSVHSSFFLPSSVIGGFYLYCYWYLYFLSSYRIVWVRVRASYRDRVE